MIHQYPLQIPSRGPFTPSESERENEKIKEQAKEIKENISNIKENIRFSFHFHSVWMGLNEWPWS